MRTLPDMRSVALALHEQLTLLEVATAYEVFGVDRGLTGEWYDFAVCGAEGTPVGGWFQAREPHGLDALAAAGTVVVPACGEPIADPPAGLVEAVRAAYDNGARVVSICTGAFVLAAAGLLDGRRATTHWMHAALLAERYPRVQVDPGVLYVDEGRILTSAGKAAGLDLCLHIVRLDHGMAVANALARRLVVPPHRPGGQAQFIPAPMANGRDHALADLLTWAMARLDRPLTVEDLARRANMSSRNLARHFNAVAGTTPLQWLLDQRVHRAQELLETTDDSVELIAARTGMGTAATLRRHFNRAVGVPPDTYRRTFRDGHEAGGS
jgi:AraC family transcriptional activator FtrA